MKASTKINAIATTIAAVIDRTLPTFATRDESRILAKALNVNPKITVKRDIKTHEGWGIKLVHNDGRGILSLSRQ